MLAICKLAASYSTSLVWFLKFTYKKTLKSVLRLQRNACFVDYGKLTSCFTFVLLNALCILEEWHDVVFTDRTMEKVVWRDIARTQWKRKTRLPVVRSRVKPDNQKYVINLNTSQKTQCNRIIMTIINVVLKWNTQSYLQYNQYS